MLLIYFEAINLTFVEQLSAIIYNTTKVAGCKRIYLMHTHTHTHTHTYIYIYIRFLDEKQRESPLLNHAVIKLYENV